MRAMVLARALTILVSQWAVRLVHPNPLGLT